MAGTSVPAQGGLAQGQEGQESWEPCPDRHLEQPPTALCHGDTLGHPRPGIQALSPLMQCPLGRDSLCAKRLELHGEGVVGFSMQRRQRHLQGFLEGRRPGTSSGPHSSPVPQFPLCRRLTHHSTLHILDVGPAEPRTRSPAGTVGRSEPPSGCQPMARCPQAPLSPRHPPPQTAGRCWCCCRDFAFPSGICSLGTQGKLGGYFLSQWHRSCFHY